MRLSAGLLTVLAIAALPSTAYWAQAVSCALLLAAGYSHGVRARTMALRLAPLLTTGLLVFALLALLGPAGPYFGAPSSGPVSYLPPVATRLTLWALLSKTGLAVLTFTVLAALLDHGELLVAMRCLRVPRPVRVVTYLVLHWLREIVEQAQSLRRAAISRGEPLGYRRLSLALALGTSLMVRCIRRADTIAFALCARGFSGDLPMLSAHSAPPGAAWSFAAYCLFLGGFSWFARWL